MNCSEGCLGTKPEIKKDCQGESREPNQDICESFCDNCGPDEPDNLEGSIDLIPESNDPNE